MRDDDPILLSSNRGLVIAGGDRYKTRAVAAVAAMHRGEVVGEIARFDLREDIGDGVLERLRDLTRGSVSLFFDALARYRKDGKVRSAAAGAGVRMSVLSRCVKALSDGSRPEESDLKAVTTILNAFNLPGGSAKGGNAIRLMATYARNPRVRTILRATAARLGHAPGKEAARAFDTKSRLTSQWRKDYAIGGIGALLANASAVADLPKLPPTIDLVAEAMRPGRGDYEGAAILALARMYEGMEPAQAAFECGIPGDTAVTLAAVVTASDISALAEGRPLPEAERPVPSPDIDIPVPDSVPVKWRGRYLKAAREAMEAATQYGEYEDHPRLQRRRSALSSAARSVEVKAIEIARLKTERQAVNEAARAARAAERAARQKTDNAMNEKRVAALQKAKAAREKQEATRRERVEAARKRVEERVLAAERRRELRKRQRTSSARTAPVTKPGNKLKGNTKKARVLEMALGGCSLHEILSVETVSPSLAAQWIESLRPIS